MNGEGKRISSLPLEFEDLVFKPEWEYAGAGGEFAYRCGVIPGKVFFSSLSGTIPEPAIEKLIPIFRNIYKRGELEGKEFIRIADYTRFDGAPAATRQKYARLLRDMNEEHGSSPVVTYVCGAALWVKAVLKITAMFVGQNFVFTETVGEAFHLINMGESCSSENKDTIQVSRETLEIINSIVGGMLWGEDIKVPEEFFSEENPLSEIALSISLAARDLHEMKLQDRKNTEEIRKQKIALEKMHHRLQQAMDAGEHGFWEYNLETGEVFLSPWHKTVLGLIEEESSISKDFWVEKMHPEDRKLVIPLIRHYIDKRQAYSVEFRVQHADGNWRWISARGKFYGKGSDDSPARVAGVHVDITEQKEFEEILHHRIAQQAAVAGLPEFKSNRAAGAA
jgi:PAS domain S-box-containing protein